MKIALDTFGTGNRNRRTRENVRPATLELKFDPDDNGNDPDALAYMLIFEADRKDPQFVAGRKIRVRNWLTLSEVLKLVSKLSQELSDCQCDLHDLFHRKVTLECRR